MKKEQLTEDLSARFQQICNYQTRVGLNEMTILNDTDLAEDDDPNAAGDDAPAGGDPNAMGGDPNAMGGDPSMGDDPNAMGGDTSMGGDPNAMGGDTSMGGDPNGDAQPPQGFNPQDMGGDPNAMGGDPSMDGDPNAMGGDMEQPGDEVLDVTELTDKQDDIEDDIKEVGDKFDKVMQALGAFNELLRSNDEKIEGLKAEFEKRNPTQIEKLSMQTAKSYPFNVTPEEFWKEKEATSNYSTEDDDNGKEQGQYVITANDVAGDTNWKAIADSLDDDDFIFHQTLDKIMKENYMRVDPTN